MGLVGSANGAIVPGMRPGGEAALRGGAFGATIGAAMPQPPVAVIVVSYNTAALLRSCLASLRACSLPLRVVVVDNGSRDCSVALVRAEFPEVALVEAGRNAGFAGGTNIGLRSLQEDYVLILNPDTEVRPGAIEALVAFLEAHPRVGLVGPRLLNPDGTPQPAAFRFPTLLMTALDLLPPGEALPGRLYGSWWHGRYPQDGGDTPFPIDHPLGACMLVRRAVLEQVGPMDESYFMYSEEVEWCWRIKGAGWAIWQEPRARVVHVGGAATGQYRHAMQVALWRSRARFAASVGPPWRLAAHTAIVRLGMLRLALLAWRDYGRGTMSRDELRARLLGCGEIARI
jgi:N-acetylglucosaminyl-diphospho-decaprenol L-rhamnosyltransferase